MPSVPKHHRTEKQLNESQSKDKVSTTTVDEVLALTPRQRVRTQPQQNQNV